MLNFSPAQSKEISDVKKHNVNKVWFISLNVGAQMSGIKDEDFVSSNYSPLFILTAGKWFTPSIAFQIGYKGFYFNAIADEVKHHYNYFYGEAVINFNNLVHPDRINMGILQRSPFGHPFGGNWNLLLHGGPGYFYNHVYQGPNICANIGIQNTYQFSGQFNISLDVAAIVGWDIYQGNKDILPGISVGIVYLFNYSSSNLQNSKVH